MDFLDLMHAMMDFQDKTNARFFYDEHNGMISCHVPTSTENVLLYRQGIKLFEE